MDIQFLIYPRGQTRIQTERRSLQRFDASLHGRSNFSEFKNNHCCRYVHADREYAIFEPIALKRKVFKRYHFMPKQMFIRSE